MDIKDKIIQEFKFLIEDNMRTISMIVKIAEETGLTNEQCYLDWEDYLNKISNLDHNIGIGSIMNRK